MIPGDSPPYWGVSTRLQKVVEHFSRADGIDQHRRAAGYVDRILKCVKPGDLPVQLATELGLGSVLARYSPVRLP
jgi:hypothetical protein